MTEKIENRFRKVGRYSQDELIRDLGYLIEQLNRNRDELETELAALRQRLDDAGIPP